MASTMRLGMRFATQLQAPSRRILVQQFRQPQFKLLPSSTSILSQRLAPFSTTTHRKILPPGPQVIHGGVNTPAPVPAPHPTHGSYHWIAERAVSVLLIPLTLAPFAAGSLNPTTDAILVASILIHSHMGFQSIVTDYIPTWQYPTTRKIFDWLLILATVVVGIGFYEFETNDVGLTEMIKRVWHAGENDITVGKADINALGHDGKLKHLKP